MILKIQESRLSIRGNKTETLTACPEPVEEFPLKLSEFFRTSPLAGIDLWRDESLPREGQRENGKTDTVLK